MIENIKFLIDLVGGNSNALSIVCFLIGIFISLFLYFKTFFRLVFSTKTVFSKRHEAEEPSNEADVRITRILLYNNGRKTLTKSDIIYLSVSCSNDILSCRLIEHSETVQINVKKRKVNINFDHLDASKYLVIEAEHKGYIKVEGRISETGEILDREPKYWLSINIVCILYILYVLFNIMLNIESEDSSRLTDLINFALIFGTIIIFNIIHSLLFIPNSLTAKFLHYKDKAGTEFKNKF